MLARIVLSLKLNAPNTTVPSEVIPPVAAPEPVGAALEPVAPFDVAAVVAAAPESSPLVHDAAQSATATAIAASHGPLSPH